MADRPAAQGLVDTNVVILREWIRKDQLPSEIAISAVTLAELSAGPLCVVGEGAEARAERSRRSLILQWAESSFDPIPFEEQAARVYGQLVGAVLSSGRTPRRRHADLQLAATAVVNGLPLFTTNPTDFIGLEDWVNVVAIPRPEIS